MSDFSLYRIIINDRVKFNSTSGNILSSRHGTVTGYSCYFPVMYIVTLDIPLDHPDYLNWSSVIADGSMLDHLFSDEEVTQF